MWRITASLGIVLAVAMALSVAGCSSEPPSSGADSPADKLAVGHDDHSHGDHAEHGQSAMDKMKMELAKLSPDDAASAERQHICPVSGEMLGTMGVPKKLDVNGQQVWICCDSCQDKLLADPEQYLAKLKNE